MVWLTNSGSALAIPSTHGVFNFHTPQNALKQPPGLNDPAVRGGELIIWWNDIEPEEGVFDWTVLDADLAQWQARGKQLDLRLSTAHNGPDFTPRWLFDRHAVRRIGRGQFTDFETSTGVYVLGHAATRSNLPAHRIAGEWAVHARHHGPDPMPVLALAEDVALVPRATYSVQCDLLALSPGAYWVEVSSATGGPPATQRFTIPATPGVPLSPSFSITLGSHADYRLQWGLTGPGELLIDNPNIIRLQTAAGVDLNHLDTGTSPWQLLPGARLTTAADEQTSTSGTSIVIENNAPGFRPLVTNDPTSLPLRNGETYRFTFLFRALSDCTLHFQLVDESSGAVLVPHTLELKAGRFALFTAMSPPHLRFSNARVQIGLIGPGKLSMDDLSWSMVSEVVTCLPDYFSPVFQQKWGEFVRRVAARYRRHPALGVVSVGGFGRWEEVMLDDDEHGILDEQWLSRGYTPERYLSLVSSCMDLYRGAFGDHPLRVCLAYGLQRQNDLHWIYRRVAQAAVSRGIGLKQNGLSELYDTWDDNTDASYLFDRFRHTPGINLTHETGGQIYRNTLEAHGHPLSCINRGLINGIDYLYLYGGDIRADHVRKYLPYATQLMGRALFTSFYCFLGDMTLKYQNQAAPTAYRHQWLGLRQVRRPEAEVALSSQAGSHCAATTPGNSSIIFDVDDRQQYSGMYHPTLFIEYWDGGSDRFQVRATNALTSETIILGEVRKRGTAQWKLATFAGHDWCRSPRNHGLDQQVDLIIDDLDDGTEAIRLVELQFVPAREWQQRELASSPPVDRHQPLTKSIAFKISLVGLDQPPAMLSLPLWNGSQAPGSLRARIYAPVFGRQLLLADKEYFYPADHDWFDLPLHSAPGEGELTIELSEPAGQVGIYLDAAGQPAWKLLGYATRPVQSSAAQTSAGLTFKALRPFCGITVPADLPFGATPELVRDVPAGLVGNAQAETLQPPVRDARGITFHFDPQLPALFHLRGFSASSVQPFPMMLHQLQRLASPLPALTPPGGICEVNLLTQDAHLQAWSNLELNASNSTTLAFDLTGPRPTLEFILSNALRAHPEQALRLRQSNTTGCGMARLSWVRSDDPIAVHSTLIPLFPNDPVPRDIVFPLGIEPEWTGMIERLVLEPVTGGTAVGHFEIESAGIERQPAP